MNLIDELVAGTVGGLAGGLVMDMFMTVARRAELIETPLPIKFEHNLEERAGFAEQTGPQAEQALAQVEHLMISGAFGAGYGALHAAFDLSVIPAGPLYGSGVYMFMLGGWDAM